MFKRNYNFLKNAKYFKNLKLNKEEEKYAYNAINSFLNDTLGTALGGFSKNSFQNCVSNLKNRYMEERRRDENDEVAMIDAVCEALCKFLKEFMLAYIKFAPVYPDAKYSTGNYLRSSLIYFNDDGGRSKQIALSRLGTGVLTLPDDFMHGESYVLGVLRSRGEKFNNREDFIKLISGGLSVENVANEEGWYYGWKKVEREGWSHHPAYSPFKLALQEASKTIVINRYKVHITYKPHNVRTKHYQKRKKKE